MVYHPDMPRTHNNRLQRTMRNKVPRHTGQRAAAEPGVRRLMDLTPNDTHSRVRSSL